METEARKYEYKIVSGKDKELSVLEEEINTLARDGWEVFQTSSAGGGGLGFGLGLGSGAGAGALKFYLIIILRRLK